jgi:hypothetical protein
VIVVRVELWPFGDPSSPSAIDALAKGPEPDPRATHSDYSDLGLAEARDEASVSG